MKFKIDFGQRLFLCVAALFVAFVLYFFAFQYRRERVYKVELLEQKLQDYNEAFAKVSFKEGVFDEANADGLMDSFRKDSIRTTLMKMDGTVFFDSEAGDVASLSNHLNRKEVSDAIKNGNGFDLKRESETTGKSYFYCATAFPQIDLIVRSSIPYSVSLTHALSPGKGFLWFGLALTIALLAIIWGYTRRIGRNIKQLRNFATRARRNEEVEDSNIRFTDDDLGEISQDIVRLYAHLKNSEDDKTRLKRQLTQNVAHELKTPVSSIHGYLETIASDPQMDPDTRNQFIQRCLAQSERLSNLVGDISLLNRMDDAEGSFDTEEVDIHELVETVAKDVHLQLEAKGMKMLNLTETKLMVSGNLPLLYSIFRNLTDNSIAYAGDGTMITVRYLGKKDGLLSFAFTDNGAGVPEEHLEHIFERFYRVDKGRSRRLGGTGLGLAIVKNAVIIHGGTITAHTGTAGGLELVFTLSEGE